MIINIFPTIIFGLFIFAVVQIIFTLIIKRTKEEQQEDPTEDFYHV